MDVKAANSTTEGQTLPFSNNVIVQLNAGDVIDLFCEQGIGSEFNSTAGVITIVRIA